jgi:hypothetical protein
MRYILSILIVTTTIDEQYSTMKGPAEGHERVNAGGQERDATTLSTTGYGDLRMKGRSALG